jgi:hypothetical protein
MKENCVGKGSVILPELSIGAMFSGILALVAVNVVIGIGTVSADELKVLDNAGNPFLVVDAPQGATFSVEAQTSFSGEGKGLLFLKNEDESFSVSSIVESNQADRVLFEGVESGVYIISSSSSSIVISKVDAIASTQALSKSSNAQDDDNSVIGKSAYAVGAAAVAGGIALGASGSSSSQAAASGSAINAARAGGSLGEVVGSSGIRTGGSQEVFVVSNSNPFFDQSRPAQLPIFPAPTPPPLGEWPQPPLPEQPGNLPAANPTPAPAPPVTQPMTLN